MTGDPRQKLPHNATVLSLDPGAGVCRHCRAKRLVYQAHFFKVGRVVAGCKSCLTEMAGGADRIRPSICSEK